MANNHRVVVNPGSLPFAGYPIKLETTIPFVANYEVLSSGGLMRSSGKRIYDTNILPSSGSVMVQPNSPLHFPFFNIESLSTYFDAVFLVDINGIRFLQGFSNAPDNVAAYSNNFFLEDKKMFGIYLKCFGVAGVLGDYNNNNHYMLGGNNSALNSGNSINIIFATPTIVPVTITPKITFYSVGSTSPTLALPSFIVPIGSIEFSSSVFNLYGELLSIGYNSYYKSGYYKIELVPSDPSYVSILPFYHWGQFN